MDWREMPDAGGVDLLDFIVRLGGVLNSQLVFTRTFDEGKRCVSFEFHFLHFATTLLHPSFRSGMLCK
eukprot:scaffold6088_cov140-Skeletonema_dohrnii-CCMP3373.AAC.9